MCCYSIERTDKSNIGESLPKSNHNGFVIVLGNFDGVHIGHAELLRATVSLAKKLSAMPAVWMFTTHPQNTLTSAPLKLLTSIEERLSLFSDFGITYAVMADFPAFRDMSPNDFLVFLKDSVGCVGAVCGYNYSFGAKGAGKASDISAFFGDSAVVISEQKGNIGEVRVCSSEIRRLVSEGDIVTANRLLGRPYSVRGTVVGGRKIGRSIDFPTANISMPEYKIAPTSGIYATSTLVDGKVYPSVTNFGTNPTVTDSLRMKLETHIIGFDEDIYGKDICVMFYKKLRDEKKFESLNALRAQISEDKKNALEFYLKIGKKNIL